MEIFIQPLPDHYVNRTEMSVFADDKTKFTGVSEEAHC